MLIAARRVMDVNSSYLMTVKDVNDSYLMRAKECPMLENSMQRKIV
jgi:hypothetical protein